MICGVSGNPVGRLPPFHCLPQRQSLPKIAEAGQGFSGPGIGELGLDCLRVSVDEPGIF